jgi:hypothetical protein
MKIEPHHPGRKDWVDGVQMDAPAGWIGWDDKTWERQAGRKTFAEVPHVVIVESAVAEINAMPQISEIRVLGSNDGLSAGDAGAFRGRYFLALEEVLGPPAEKIHWVNPEFPGVERAHCIWFFEQSVCVAGVHFSFERATSRDGCVEYVTCSVTLSRTLKNPVAEQERREILVVKLRGARA